MSLKTIASRLDRCRPYDLLDRPIFILTPPRSGSTFLFELLCQFGEAWAWHAETDDIWHRLFPYHRLEEPSDHVGRDEYTPTAARLLRRDFYRHSLWARQERGTRCSLAERARQVPIRYVDKTLANCFHAGFLKEAFPDARYIVLFRDGRASISSMMEGWRDPVRFVNARIMPYVRAVGAGQARWCYSAPPGWRDVIRRPLEEICAWSWSSHVRSALDAVADVPDDRKLVLHYEDLTGDPLAVAARIGRFCGFAWRAGVADFVARRPLSRTTVSPPGPRKWQTLHGERIDRICDMIIPEMSIIGYKI